MAVKSELSEQKLGYIREFVNHRDPKEEYKLIQSIGIGTYGEVYKALCLRTKELAAVKLIKIDAKDDVRAILQEIQTLRDCRHANIVQFFGSYFRNNKLWICMEFCGGFSMQDIYTNIRRPIEESCIAFVTRETLRGIEYMHKAGKIHRDIKGANILLTNEGDVKIADFGVAAQITQTIQRRNSFIGTPYWMAPEVAAVERKGGYDEKCDIWALGITAMEYAELQPPLFDLHPMRALRVLGMRSYKPPTLRNKADWSPKFHSFLKAALTKSEKKRPTAQALLRHEMVTQPHLSRALTLRLLEINRNPDRLLGNSTPCTAADRQPVLKPVGPASPPVPALLAGRPDIPNNDGKDRTLVRSTNRVEKKADNSSVIAKQRPRPPDKLHTPWTNRSTDQDVFSASSTASTPVNSHGAFFQAWAPAERIPPSRSSAFNGNGTKSNGQKNGSSKPVLEDVCIMDELPTPLPAYAPTAPTACPAVKPSRGSVELSSKQSNVVSRSHHQAVTSVVTCSHVSSCSVSAVSDVSTIASSDPVSSFSSSSCSSASTSPRSSCSSVIMETVQQAEKRLHSGQPINGQFSADPDLKPRVPNQCNGSAVIVMSPSTNDLAPEHLSAVEAEILQDSSEAQFIPVNDEALVLAPENPTHLSDRRSTVPAACSMASVERSSASSESEDDDDDSEEDDIGEDGVDHLSDVSDRLSHISVTTIDSNSQASVSPSVSQHSLPDQVTTHRPRATAPVAAVENSDEWDLGVAGEELLATDGVLQLNHSRPESVGDHISEFGFRIHGPSDGEDEDGDDEEEDELGQTEIVIPTIPSDFDPGMTSQMPGFNNITTPGPRMSNSDDSGHLADSSAGPDSSLPNGHVPSGTNKTDPDTVPCKDSFQVNGFYGAISLDALYPEKSGEELMSLLRQLKFAQKFAWLSGSSLPTPPIPNLSSISSPTNYSPSSASPHTALTTSDPAVRSAQSNLSPNSSSAISDAPITDHLQTASLPNRTQASSLGVEPSLSLSDSCQSEAIGARKKLEEAELLRGKSDSSEQRLIFPLLLVESQLVESVVPIDSEAAVQIIPETMAVYDVQTGACDAICSSASLCTTHKMGLDLNLPNVQPEDSPTVESEPVRSPASHVAKVISRTLDEQLAHTSPHQFFTSLQSLPTDRDLCLSKPDRSSSTVEPASLRNSETQTPVVQHSMSDIFAVADVQISSPVVQPRSHDAAKPRPHSDSSASRQSRLSIIECPNVNERPLHANCADYSVTQHSTGTCFSLVFEGCPLKINATATWNSSMSNGQIILFGTNDGIYYLNTKGHADSSLELLFPRRCLWLSVVRDTMISLSGRHPQLYRHNLVSLMKLKLQGHAMNDPPSKLGKISKIIPKRFSPSKKIPDTKGCQRVSVTRSPFNGAKYLCAVIGREILVMEWFNPVSSFIGIKRVPVPDIPSPLLTFDLLILKDRPLPLACLGVYRHHSKRGRENQRYRLHIIDLNAPVPHSAIQSQPNQLRSPLSSPQITRSFVVGPPQLPGLAQVAANSSNIIQNRHGDGKCAEFLAKDLLPVIEVVQLEHNTVLVCFQDCAKVISLNGRIKSSRHRATTLDYDGIIAESIVCLRDSILVFHPHGLLGKSFTGELTQQIHDEKHVYRLLGCDRNIVVESRPADDPMSNSNIYLLAGHVENV